MNPEYLVEVKNVSQYIHGPSGAKLHVLEKINFKLIKKEGEGIIAGIVSPSSSGKTTLLKIISAIEKPSAGEVYLGGKIYSKPVGAAVYIPEKPSSFPWMNVKQNIEFAANVSGSEGKKENIDKILSAAGLTGYGDHFPHEKSLGFRFRISIARALAAGAQIILLDDPLKNLHGEVKKEIIDLVMSIPKNFDTSFILTTSNINDAVSLSGKLFLMTSRPGRIIQELDVERQVMENNPEYISILKKEIEKYFAAHENIPSLAG